MECNAVFEGGGIRGIAHVGAASVLQQAGYHMRYFAGSSAGAIVASLLAAGYTADELRPIMQELDFTAFLHKRGVARLGAPGKMASLFTRFGIYDADLFEDWLSDLLAKRGVRTFGTLSLPAVREGNLRWPLQVTACDIYDQRLLILPRDLADFGIDPNLYPVAKAVRMSMSIPIFFKPFPLKDKKGRVHLIVDGSLLSSYPVWLFERDCLSSSLPTVGFDFVGDRSLSGVCKSKLWPDFLCYLSLLVSTAMDAVDKQQATLLQEDEQGTVKIPVIVETNGRRRHVSPTDFDLTQDEKKQLFQNGETAARRFLARQRLAQTDKRASTVLPAPRYPLGRTGT